MIGKREVGGTWGLQAWPFSSQETDGYFGVVKREELSSWKAKGLTTLGKSETLPVRKLDKVSNEVKAGDSM